MTPQRPPSSGLPAALLVLIPFLFFLAVLVFLGSAPAELLILYAVASVASLIMYGMDKLAAARGRWRVREASLHMVSLFGGWPGALVAQQLFRHKTVKRPFRLVFWFTAAANCALLLWFITGWPAG